MKNKQLLFISLSFLISSVASGQANFTGSWAINESKSNLGEFRMFSPVIAITQDATTFTIEKTYKGRDGQERKTTEKYTLDGKESINKVFGNTDKKSSATWSEDKQSLKVSSSMVFEYNGEKNEMKAVEVYKLSDEGKTLSIDNQSTSSMGEFKTLLVYEKK